MTRPAYPPPSPAAGKWLAILSLTVMATAALAYARQPFLLDFISFWAASALAIGGDASAAYDVDLLHAVQSQVFDFDARMPFAYPPPFLLLVMPFGMMPFGAAAMVWVGLGLAAYVAAVRKLMPGYAGWAIGFAPVIVCAVIGQNGLLTAALFIAGIGLSPRHSFWAGAVLGCLIVKPHLGVLLPLAFLAARDWRAIAGAACSVIALCAASLLAFGFGPWLAFAGQLGTASSMATENLVGWYKMASVFAMARMAGVPETAAFLLHASAAVAGAMLVWRVWRTNTDAWTRGAALAPATLLVSPYLFMYDQTMLIVSLGWLASRGADRRLLALLFALPVLAALQFWLPGIRINAAPLLTLAVLVLVWDGTRERARHTIRLAA